jgi:hypothetical protein
MTNRSRFALFLSLGLVAILSLALVACGNDDDDNGVPSDDANGAPTDDVDDDDAAPPPDDANGDDDVNGNDDPEDLAEALRRAAEGQQERPLSITYEIQWMEDEVMQWRIDRDPPRYAMRVEGDFGDGEMGSFAFIFDGEYSYSCIDEDGGFCMRFEGEEDQFLDEFLFFDQEELLREIAEEEGAELRPTSGQTFAGISGECFEATTVEGSGVVCVSTQFNILLFAEGTFDGEYSRMEVIEFSDSPAPNAFEPPYPVMDLGDFGDFDDFDFD